MMWRIRRCRVLGCRHGPLPRGRDTKEEEGGEAEGVGKGNEEEDEVKEKEEEAESIYCDSLSAAATASHLAEKR